MTTVITGTVDYGKRYYSSTIPVAVYREKSDYPALLTAIDWRAEMTGFPAHGMDEWGCEK